MKRLITITAIVLMPVVPVQAAHLAIIIDDLGHNEALGRRAIDLPGPVTVSILPYTAHSRVLAEVANERGKEVMVHLPMANISNLPIGPGGLDASLSMEDFIGRLSDAIASVPHARGMNNHMGSYLTQQPREMGWLMTELRHRRLFFVDSRTTPGTVASKLARQSKLLSSSRDVFLDNTLTFYEVDRAFKKLISIARRKGTAIAIAHPHDVTLHYLEIALPLLADEGITILPTSQLLAIRQAQVQAHPSARNAGFNVRPGRDKVQSPRRGPGSLHRLPAP